MICTSLAYEKLREKRALYMWWTQTQTIIRLIWCRWDFNGWTIWQRDSRQIKSTTFKIHLITACLSLLKTTQNVFDIFKYHLTTKTMTHSIAHWHWKSIRANDNDIYPKKKLQHLFEILCHFSKHCNNSLLPKINPMLCLVLCHLSFGGVFVFFVLFLLFHCIAIVNFIFDAAFEFVWFGDVFAD